MKRANVKLARKKLPDGLKSSNFFITIVTNKVPRGNNIAEFTQAANEYFDNIDQFFVFQDGVDPSDEYLFPEGPQVTLGVEVGDKMHRLHLHATVTLKHRSWVQIDLPKSNSYWRDFLGGDRAKIRVDTFNGKSPAQVIADYLAKSQEFE